jgi:hypothetical protein
VTDSQDGRREGETTPCRDTFEKRDKKTKNFNPTKRDLISRGKEERVNSIEGITSDMLREIRQ